MLIHFQIIRVKFDLAPLYNWLTVSFATFLWCLMFLWWISVNKTATLVLRTLFFIVITAFSLNNVKCCTTFTFECALTTSPSFLQIRKRCPSLGAVNGTPSALIPFITCTTRTTWREKNSEIAIKGRLIVGDLYWPTDINYGRDQDRLDDIYGPRGVYYLLQS